MAPNIFLKAKRHAERAIARGDIKEAERWVKIMSRHAHVALTVIELAGRHNAPRPKPKPISLTREQRARIAAEDQARAARPSAGRLPVMLDPDGFSPGGQPNWYLNLERLKRAGLSPSLAPPNRAERLRQQTTPDNSTAAAGRPGNVT